MTQDFEELKKWIGQKETDVDYVTIPAVHRLAATLDLDYPMPKFGDPLPSGWQSILFPRVVRQSQVGADGHPQRGDFLPPVPLPRRMFAGKRTTMHSPLHVGDEVRRESTIMSVTPKEGRSGQMVFVTVKTVMLSPRGLAITEQQDIVYREEPDPNAPPAAAQRAPGKAIWQRKVTPDPVLLFRYSALTFNGHRIHYDHPYVTNTEGYPDLVMNAKTPMKYMASRNVRPLFVNREFTVCAEPTEDGKTAKLWVVDDSDALALTADADFE
jgi:3-methylfumaryl-CoA hydratase